MTTTNTAGVYFLAAEHAGAVHRFLEDPDVARMVGTLGPPFPMTGVDVVARASAARIAGDAYWNAIVDGGDTKGLSAILGPYTPEPRLAVWIAPAARGNGYGRLATRLGLEMAFRNLQAPQVFGAAAAADRVSHHLLDDFGFEADDGSGEQRRLTRDHWRAHRDRPALMRLHPTLRAILDAELAAGNEVAETGGGWPDPESVFVRLKLPFRTHPSAVPADIVYTEPNDPHWWLADYSSQSPRHILAC